MPELFGLVGRMLSQKGMILSYYFLFCDRVQATKPKTSGNEPKEIVNEDLSYVRDYARSYLDADLEYEIIWTLFELHIYFDILEGNILI